MAQLSHPNIVQVYDVGTIESGDIYISMEYVEGETLASWIRGETRRPWRELLKVFLQAARGLQAAHEAGLVHRDFKPENVLVDRSGRPRVLDFGLVRSVAEPEENPVEPSLSLAQGGRSLESGLAVEATMVADGSGRAETPALATGASTALRSRLTVLGTVMGTPAYMAPEQFRGEVAGAQADQFSFCVSLFEALYGRGPFSGETLFALQTSVCEGEIELGTTAGVPGWLR